MLSCIKLRVVVAPLVIVLFEDFARLQHGSGLLPEAAHFMQPGGVLALPYINLQADFSGKPSAIPRYFYVIPRRRRKK